MSNDNVVINSKSNASAQAWRFVKDSSNAYTIINEKTGKVLTSGTAEGDQVTTTADTGANSQKWYIYQKDGKYMIAPKSVPSCILDVYNDETADGTNIIIWKNKDDGSLNQLFTIEKGSFFDLYVNSCKFEMSYEEPVEIKTITSDDVFDYLLDIRSINANINRRKERLSKEYLETKFSDQNSSFDNYEQLKNSYDSKIQKED